MKIEWKKRFVGIALLLTSTVIALLLCELISHVVFDRVDYLSPTLVRDEILGVRLPPGSGGHDQWGFRNPAVPATAEIVALGDSHTYGNCARMKEAWPHVLGPLTGRTVYSLGMGGYGPNQYYHLLKTKALALKPHTIVCGFYMGDDFHNAFRITYGLEHWSYLRRGRIDNVDPDIWEKQTVVKPAFQKRIRIWLSEHSVLYRLVVHGILLKVKAGYQLKNAARIYGSATTLILPEKNVQEAFLPKGLLRGLDQEDPAVREGMRLTFNLLKEMNTTCTSNQVRFLVAVIPTKETVFGRYLENNPELAMSDVLKRVIVNERAARQELFSMLKQENIAFVDLLPAMEKAAETERLYTPGASDMHPNNAGYRVIASELSAFLTKTGRANASAH
jgi:hypothetical protein